VKQLQRNSRNALKPQVGSHAAFASRQRPARVPNTAKADQATTKLLMAASEKLWQYVLEGSATRRGDASAVADDMEAVDRRPQALQVFDFDKFARNLHLIKDEDEEVDMRHDVLDGLAHEHVPPNKGTRADARSRPVHAAPQARGLDAEMQWQV